MREPIYDEHPTNILTRIRESFKRDLSRRITPQDPKLEAEARAAEGRAAHSGHYYDIHQAMLQTAHSGLARKLKGRHLQMIAIGGSIGMLYSVVSPCPAPCPGSLPWAALWQKAYPLVVNGCV
jgi:amino acid transporter